VSTGFNDSKDFDLKDKILIWKTKTIQIQSKKFEDAELQTLLDENSARTLEELAEALNVGKSTIFVGKSTIVYTQWEIQKEDK